MARIPDLNHLLEYKNPRVIKRYQRDYPHQHEQAERLLSDLLKYFWLCKKHAIDKRNHPEEESLKFMSMMHHEMRDIDDMWHTFILHTQDYADFCHLYFDDFLHHVPHEEEDQPEILAGLEEDLTRYLSYIYDHLGEETVCRWFAEHL